MDAIALAAPLPGVPVVVAPTAAPAAVRVIVQEIHTGPVAARLSRRAGRVALAGIVGRIHTCSRAADLSKGAGTLALPAVGRVGLQVPAGSVTAGLHGRPV